MFGVIALSLAKCDLLSNTVEDIGPSAYVLGNSLVHYYPTLKIWICRPNLKKRGKQITLSLVIFSLYLAKERAEKVYGCPLPHEAVTFGSLAAIPVTIGAHYLSHVKPSKE